jgi:hypothetical protein
MNVLVLDVRRIWHCPAPPKSSPSADKADYYRAIYGTVETVPLRSGTFVSCQ